MIAPDPQFHVRVQEETIAHLRAKLKQTEDRLQTYREEGGQQREIAGALAEAVKAIEPYPRVSYKLDKSPAKLVTLSADVSDLHIGEVVDRDEIEGLNVFNFETAERRMFTYASHLIKWTAIQRRAYPIKELVVQTKGDYVSGGIHQELLATNEFPVPVQAVKAGHLLGEFVARLAPHFDKVRVLAVGADNHGRLNPKPQAKQKASNSFSFIVHDIAQMYLNRHSNVEWINAVGMKMIAEIGGHRFLIEHGDTIRGWQGLPFYGIVRHMMKESMKRMGVTDRDFHYYSLAHFHCPYILENRIFGNGSLSGTSEYDHACGRHADPAQVSYLVHPEHGTFNWVPWRLV